MNMRRVCLLGTVCVGLSKLAIAQTSQGSDPQQTLAQETQWYGDDREARMASFSIPRPTGNLEVLQAMNVVTTADKSSGSVHFFHAGKLHHYDHVAVSVYSEDAVALRTYAQGTVPVPIGGQPRTFRSYADGAAAALSIDEDGFVSGLFEVDGELMGIRPAPEHVGETNGSKIAHTIQRVDLSNFPSGKAPLANATSNRGALSLGEITRQKNWGGTRWYPGCYRGDRDMHKMVIGMFSDVQATTYKKGAKKTQAFFEAVTNEASFIFEQQMNFMLQLGYTHTYEKGGSCKKFWCEGTCHGKWITGKLSNFGHDYKVPFMAANHLWSGCGKGYGVVGMAYVSETCGNKGSAVDDIKTPGVGGVVTFAHELGHNLGAGHAGIGGVMGGSGKYKGWYQFNTKYRKKEMCRQLNWSKGHCRNKFVPVSWPVLVMKRPTKYIEIGVGTVVVLVALLSLQPCFYNRVCCCKRCPRCIQKRWEPCTQKVREFIPNQCKKFKSCLYQNLCVKICGTRRAKLISYSCGSCCKGCMDALQAPFKKLHECMCSKKKPTWTHPMAGGRLTKKKSMCGQCMDTLLAPFRKVQDCLCGKKKRTSLVPLLRA